MGAWPVPCTRSGCRGSVFGSLDPIWMLWGRGRSPWSRLAEWGHGWFPGSRLVAVGVWPVSLVLSGRVGAWLVPWVLGSPLGDVSGPLHLVLVAMGVWPVPWVPSGRRRYVAGLLGPVSPTWGCGRPVSRALDGRREDVAGPLAPSGRRGGVPGYLGPGFGRRVSVATTLGPVWTLCGYG